MEKFIVEGEIRLKGEYIPSGNKNEVLPVIAASLLTDEPVLIKNVPELEDVKAMISILLELGAEVEWKNKNEIRIEAKNITKNIVEKEIARKIRASVLIIGPMLGRSGSLKLYPPGGDVIGKRKLDTHFCAIEQLGGGVEVRDNYYYIERKKLRGGKIFLEEQSVTATENIIMASVLAQGVTYIENAACEPHIQGLCEMLISMGAEISGVGTNLLKIRGVSHLKGCTYRIGSDYLEIGSIAGIGAIIGDGIYIKNANSTHLKKVLRVFEKFGISYEWKEDCLFIPPHEELVIKPDYHGHIPQIDDAPWPQFPTDMMSIAILIATQAKGTVLFFEKMYDGRMFFVDHLISMGAQIILCDPHRVVVVGPSKLYGSTIESPDIRAGMALLGAALCARGKTTIYNIHQIDRGYEKIDEKLKKLGANIDRIKIE